MRRLIQQATESSRQVSVLGVIALAVTTIATAVVPVHASEAKLGEKAPAFELEDAEGNAVALSDFEGKIVVLEWTNPDCPFVKRHHQAKTTVTLSQRYAEKDVVWLAVNSTHYSTPESNREWAESQAISYPILGDAAGDVGRLYGAKTTPHMFVIDRDGVLVYEGAIDDDPRGGKESSVNHVEAAVNALLEGGTIAIARTKPYGCSVKYAKSKKEKSDAAS